MKSENPIDKCLGRVNGPAKAQVLFDQSIVQGPFI